MMQSYYMRFWVFLLAILVECFNHSSAIAQESAQKSEIKFGLKGGFYPFAWSGYGGICSGNTYPVGLFGEYTSPQVPRSFINGGIEVGLRYRSADIGVHKRDIDPVARSKPHVGCPHLEGTIPLNLKSLAIPMLAKIYYGKCNKFCLFFGFYISYILTAKKSEKTDPREAFAQTAAYALLSERDKRPSTEAYEKAYSTFYNEWKKRENKYAPLSVENIFPSRWGVGWNMGLSYEMNMGLILGVSILYEGVGMKAGTLGPIFELGYNLNKIVEWTPAASSKIKRTC